MDKPLIGHASREPIAHRPRTITGTSTQRTRYAFVPNGRPRRPGTVQRRPPLRAGERRGSHATGTGGITGPPRARLSRSRDGAAAHGDLTSGCMTRTATATGACAGERAGGGGRRWQTAALQSPFAPGGWSCRLALGTCAAVPTARPSRGTSQPGGDCADHTRTRHLPGNRDNGRATASANARLPTTIRPQGSPDASSACTRAPTRHDIADLAQRDPC